MADAPLLEYARSSSKRRKFRLGFLAGLGAGIIANVVPYVFTYHAYDGDGFEQIGFPLTFREQGGYYYRYTFSTRALALDICICLCTALTTGVIVALWKPNFRPDPR